MEMIKSDLDKLGIKHDSFISEKEIVKTNKVDDAINQLKKTNMLRKGTLNHQKVKIIKVGKKLKD